MKTTPNADFTHQIMKAIQQTDEWDRIWTQDPAIQTARSQLEIVMEPVESKELRDSLLDAIFELTTACENASIRYGVRVAQALLNAAAHP